MSHSKLGIDIGNVLMAADPAVLFAKGADYSEEKMLAIPPVSGAFYEVSRLTCSVFGPENVYLVSKAYSNTAAKTLRWLNHHDFYGQTGVLTRHVFFVESHEAKVEVCEGLEIDFFVDDQLGVLRPMEGRVAHRYQFGAVPESADPRVVYVPDWRHAGESIRHDYAQELVRG